jgi:hypothetical protein
MQSRYLCKLAKSAPFGSSRVKITYTSVDLVGQRFETIEVESEATRQNEPKPAA